MTYKEEFLPRYNNKPCFSAADIRRFKENLEFLTCQYILQYFKKPYTAANRDNIAKPMYRKNVKNLIVSEYGGEYHRPHYHIETFNRLDFIKPYVLQELIGKAWCKENINKKVVLFNYTDEKGKFHKATKFTGLGGFDPKPAHEKVVKGIGNLIYLSGYLCKDDDFYSAFKEDLEGLTIKEKNKFKPRTYFYRGFGASILEYYSVDELLTGKIKTPAPAQSSQDFQLVEVPKYIIRRIIYDKFKYQKVNENGYIVKAYKYYRNENSVIYRGSHFFEHLNSMQQEVYNTLAFARSLNDSRIDSAVFDKINANIYRMCLYNSLFRDRFVDGFDTEDIKCIDAPCDAVDYFKHVLLERIRQKFVRVTHPAEYEHRQIYYDPVFDNLITQYNEIKRIVGAVKDTTAQQERAEKARQRKIFKAHKCHNSYLKYY